ncbi:MAG: hypothetical protein HQL37_05445 [Alphaproteobacteria bacterium]|nr:hypothetical protein [Alphaproteobacteria bacterium]
MAIVSIADIAAALRGQAESAAVALLGEPSSRSRSELRYGQHGSLSIAIASPKAGLWHDHSASEGGDILDLARRELGRDAGLTWARSWLGLGDTQTTPVYRVPAPASESDATHKLARVRDLVARSVTRPAVDNAYDTIRAELDNTPRWKPSSNQNEATPPTLSEDALAVEFTAKHGGTWRYVSGWGRWLEWDGCRWQFDKTLKVYDLERRICRAAAATAEADDALNIASARTAAAVEKLAKADRQHAATVEMWDTDPWVLNTPKGVVDLTTGKIRPHRPEDYLTKITAVAPEGECPIWLQFLDRVTAGDVDLAAFLRRIMGYALTGVTRDHALFFAHGSGSNGKGVCLNTMTRLLGDYAAVAPMETFTATASDRHPTDLASLRGARLVTAQETEEGRRWAEAKIKSLTGGDPISARFMRQDFFTFEPQLKLVIAGNHKPSLRSIDEAIRRRFHLLPFTVTIPAAERDASLPQKLEAEWGGILTWAIQGCLEWQRIGLKPPKVVIAATEKYLSEEDSFATWLGECTEIDVRGWETSADLFGSWNAWAERNGEHKWDKKRFGQAMETRGYEAGRTKTCRRYSGLRLIREDMNDAHWHQ